MRTMGKKLCMIIALIVSSTLLSAQSEKSSIRMNLEEVIQLANDSSLNAFIAQNTYMAGYWDFKNFKTRKLPFLNLKASPVDFSRQYSQQYNFQDSSYYYIEQQTFGASGNISLNQTIMKTGGYLYLDSDLGYLNNLNQSTSGQYFSTPVRIGYSQQLFGYNPYKWLNQISPVKFEKAKKQFVEDMVNVSIIAVNAFFALARTQVNLDIAETTLANADTLYSIGTKRFELATISREDLYTLKLKLVNARNDYDRAKTELKRAQMQLNSLLRLDNSVNIELELPVDLPELRLVPEECLNIALQNNPEIFEFTQRKLEAERDVENARKNSKMKADLNASFGLNQQGNNLNAAYRNPSDQEIVRVGVNIPILDWGLSKSEYKLAQKQQEVIKASVEQSEIDFRQTVLLTVEEFNLQKQFVEGAEEADTIASMAYDITRRRYISGQADIIKLGSYQTSSISAKRAYINALASYWSYYYTIRKLTLHDFEKGQDIEHRIETGEYF